MDKKKKKRLKRYFKELVFLLIWSVIFIKLFIGDIERIFFEKHLPEFEYLLNYRFVFYSFILVVLWYFLNTKRFLKNILYVVGFPFYILIWKIPKFFFWRIPKYMIIKRNWIFMYSYINSFINHFWSFKFNVFRDLLMIIGVILTFTSTNKYLLYIALISLLFLLIVLIYKKFKVAFQPLGLFRLNVELSKLNEKKKRKDFVDTIITDIKEAEVIEDEDKHDEKAVEKIEKKKKENIEKIILIKSIFSFISSRLTDFLSRRTYIVVFFVKTLITFITAWFLISMMNYVSYKLSIDSFNLKIIPTFLDFYIYTFHSMLHGSVPDIIPVDYLAKLINILAPFTSILITGTLLTVFFTVKTDQYKENLKEIIAFSNSQLDKLEKLLEDIHKCTIDEALQFLEIKKSYVCIIVKEIDKIEQTGHNK